MSLFGSTLRKRVWSWLPTGVAVSGRPGARGDPRGLNLALKQLMDGPFNEKDVKVAVRDKDGAAKIELLAELVSTRNSANIGYTHGEGNKK